MAGGVAAKKTLAHSATTKRREKLTAGEPRDAEIVDKGGMTKGSRSR